MKPLARLGQVMRLTGARPHPCLGCGAIFIVAGRGGHLARFCTSCRATRCRSCHARAGTHYAHCGLLKARPCRGCGVELGHADHGHYCDWCRKARCPECGRYAHQHAARCRWERRARRPGLTKYIGLVATSHILALYEQHRPQALAIARAIVGTPECEDVVQDVFFYLLSNCGYLPAVPGPGYLFTAVKNVALRRHLYAHARYVTAMDLPTLLVAEQVMAGRARGRPGGDLVRLPS